MTRETADNQESSAGAKNRESVLLQAAHQSAIEGFWAFDFSRTQVVTDPQFRRILGFVDDAPQTVSEWASLVHPQDLDRLTREIKGVVAGGDSVSCEARIQHADGSYRWLCIRTMAGTDPDDPAGLQGSVLDISDRRLGEEVLERLVRQNTLILNAAAEAICCVDAAGDVTFANPAAARLLSTTVPELMGRGFCRFVDGCEGSSLHPHANHCPISEGSTLVRLGRHEAQFVRADLVKIDVEYSSSFVASDGTGNEGHVIVFGDVSEKKATAARNKEARERLARSEKLAALGTLVSGVGHELRTPMSYINNHLYLIQRRAEELIASNPELEEVGADLIKRSKSGLKGITRMAGLLDDLRETYRPDDAEFDQVDVRDVVARAASLFRGAYEGPVELVERLHDTGRIPVQPGRLQQIVINLLNNAAEAMPRGGVIELMLNPTDAGAAIEVRDNGPGIPPEILATIFKPFYTTKPEGSGLGLYLVKQIVDRHMGRIHCTSEVGKGTTFRVDLVRAPLGQGRASATPRSVPITQTSRVDNMVATAGKTKENYSTTVETNAPIPSTSKRTSSPGER